MRRIESRIKKIEDKLNVGKKPLIIELVYFGDGEPPPDTVQGNIIVTFVKYGGRTKQ